MVDPAGESNSEALRLDFDRRLMLQFRGSVITSDAGMLPYRELDDAVGLTDTGAETLAEARTGKNGRHRLAGLLRQSVFGRLAGYEDVNDADRLCRDPAMRWVVGEGAITGSAASASQMGRFETRWLTRPENLAALADLSGQCTQPKSCCPGHPVRRHTANYWQFYWDPSPTQGDAHVSNAQNNGPRWRAALKWPHRPPVRNNRGAAGAAARADYCSPCGDLRDRFTPQSV